MPVAIRRRRFHLYFPWTAYRYARLLWLSRTRRSAVGATDGTVIATRSANADLYRLSQASLSLPWPSIRIVGLDSWCGSIDYFYRIIHLDAEWVISIDEDCFIFDNVALRGLVERMKREGYAMCGIPDGGACKHRTHNPVVPNAFFCVFHISRIREFVRLSKIGRIDRTRYSDSLRRHVPTYLLKPGYMHRFDNHELCYGLFFHLLLSGCRALYLPSRELPDGITTEVSDPDGQPFLFHTWFAREFAHDGEHRARIEAVYWEARRRARLSC